MPRYRVNSRFGPWQPGDEFESVDPWHANLEGGVLTDIGSEEDDESGWPEGRPGVPDTSPADKPLTGWEEGAGGVI